MERKTELYDGRMDKHARFSGQRGFSFHWNLSLLDRVCCMRTQGGRREENETGSYNHVFTGSIWTQKMEEFGKNNIFGTEEKKDISYSPL